MGCILSTKKEVIPTHVPVRPSTKSRDSSRTSSRKKTKRRPKGEELTEDTMLETLCEQEHFEMPRNISQAKRSELINHILDIADVSDRLRYG